MLSIRPLEASLQRELVGLLVGLGFRVEQIGVARTNGATGWQGNDLAATDLNIRHGDWPRAFRIHVELKRDLEEAQTLPRSRERRKVAQWAAYLEGSSLIAWDMASALSCVLEACMAARGGAERLADVMQMNGWEFEPFTVRDALIRGSESPQAPG